MNSSLSNIRFDRPAGLVRFNGYGSGRLHGVARGESKGKREGGAKGLRRTSNGGDGLVVENDGSLTILDVCRTQCMGIHQGMRQFKSNCLSCKLVEIKHYFS